MKENFRLDELQAAVLRVKLRHLIEWTEMRRNNVGRYRSLFEEMGLSREQSWRVLQRFESLRVSLVEDAKHE